MPSPPAPRAKVSDVLFVKGAREHNLRIDELTIPKNAFVVFTGVSGSGKSSLAFDTIYAEGQRRYVESLSTYARQFLGQLDKPKYEQIRGLCPTVAIEQKTASSNPRSTVGTVTEIYDYLRVLFARAGDQRCPTCGGEVRARSATEVASELATLKTGTKVTVYAPVVELRKGELVKEVEDLKKSGFVRARIDGAIVRLDDFVAVDKKKKHTLEVVVDRITVEASTRARLIDSVETGLRTGKGRVIVGIDGAAEKIYSETRACTKCKTSLPELSPQSLSYNSPLGMCPACAGLGSRLEVDPELIVSDPSLTIDEGAIEPWRNVAADSGWTARIVNALCQNLGIKRDVPFAKLPQKKKDILFFGADKRIDVKWTGKHSEGSWAMKWEGLVPQLLRRYEQTSSEQMRDKYKKYLREAPCTDCKGVRLRPEARAVFVGKKSITEILSMTIVEAAAFFSALDLEGERKIIAEEILKEIAHRLGFLLDVGLDYLTLNRATASLSGGEAQRIRLASQLGSELSGVMYILDEPSIGLHQRDNTRLIKTLVRLRDLGNTVIVVEHDAETIMAADHVVDFGPGAGKRGGHVVAQGSPAEIASNKASLTALYVNGERQVADDRPRRKPTGFITVEGAKENNLRNVTVGFPLGVLGAITGVSGAGKSSLVTQILEPALRRKLHNSVEPVGRHRAITGVDAIDKVITIDQQPIGRTPRSNPATYTKLFDLVRNVFAQTKEARAFAFDAGRFSFNVKGGRCEACEGGGVREIEMHFLPSVHVVCETCRGKRYNEATLRVLFREKTIAEVLEMSVSEALELFHAFPQLVRILKTLDEVGLGYMALGQPATTLSGGEAQRIKLARELARRDTGRTLYVLDEPTTGLHFEDIRKLIEVLRRLVDGGNSVLVVEHNIDVIRHADYVIDLGPEGGDKGGELIAVGTPEEVARVARSHTGQFLAPFFAGKSRSGAASKTTAETKTAKLRASKAQAAASTA